MTEIRIRRELDTESRLLADVPFEQISTVIPTIKGWGVADIEDGELEGELVGRFVIGNDGTAFFEVVVTEPVTKASM